MALNEFVQTALDEEGYEEGSDGYTKYLYKSCGFYRLYDCLSLQQSHELLISMI